MRGKDFFLNDEIEPLLKSAGLATFEELMSRKLGAVVTPGNMTQVIKLNLSSSNGQSVFYLKRTVTDYRTTLRSIFRLCRPRTETCRERRIILKLAEHGFSTMRIVAWGEERKFGLPSRGFILTEEVPGNSMHELYKNGDPTLRRSIAESYGELTAKLHVAGFFQSVRLKDLICPSSEPPFSPTLIDRVSAKTGRKPFFLWFALNTIRRGFRRMARDGINFNPTELRQFAEAYALNLAPKCVVSASFILSKM